MVGVPNNRATAFFETHVMPSVEAWKASPLDLRLAMQAAGSLNQMVDHFWHQYGVSEPDRVFGQTTVGRFRRLLARQHPDFGLIRDVADAHKHVILDRPDRVVTSAGQAGLGDLGFGEAEFGVARFGGDEEVVIELDSGARTHFSGIVDDVVEMWEEMIGNDLP